MKNAFDMTIKEFQKVYHAWKTENSNMPPHTVPKTTMKDRTERDLKKAISCFCKMHGFGFLPYDSRGRKLPNGKFAYSHMKKGAPDCIVLIPYRSGGSGHTSSIVVHVEIKMKGDRQRDHQRKFQIAAEQRGERYTMPSSFADFYRVIEHYIKIASP